MGIVELIVVFILVWWLIFFAALPFGVARHRAPTPGADPGAPSRPMLVRKALATSVIAAALTGTAQWLLVTGRFSLRSFFGG